MRLMGEVNARGERMGERMGEVSRRYVLLKLKRTGKMNVLPGSARRVCMRVHWR